MRVRFIKTIFLKELLDILRDRRVLFRTVVLPILLYPLLFIGFFQITAVQLRKIEEKKSRVAVVGKEHAGSLGVTLDTLSGITCVDTTRWRSRIVESEIEAALVIPPGFVDSLTANRPASIAVYFNSSKEVSRTARERLDKTLGRHREEIVASRLATLGADTALVRPYSIQAQNLATAQQQQGDFLGRVLGYMLIIMTLGGAFFPAIDLTAGEKERGTLETLLVSPVSRGDIVYGKFFAVLTIAIITAVLNLFSMAITMIYGFRIIGESAARVFSGIAISPVSLLLALLLMIPLAIMFAAACLAIAVTARNYKEGQSVLTPIYTVVLMPAMISLVPGTQMSPILALIPIANVSLLIKEFMVGNYLWVETGIAFLSTSALAILSLAWATSQFRQESILFRHAEDIRWSPFRRRRMNAALPAQLEPRSAVLVIAVALVVLFSFSAQAAEWGAAKAILVSQVIILALPLYVLVKRRLNVPAALGLRRPPLAAWPATTMAMIGGWLVSIELATVMNELLPFPTEYLQEFETLFADLRAYGTSSALLLIAVLPGVCEELLCRGFLLRSFIPRYGKTVAVIMAAVAFGFLHLDPYRLLNTTLLGLLLGYIVVQSGSIYPAILGHALNNALSFLAQEHQAALENMPWLSESDSQFLPLPVLMIAVLLLAGGMLWLARVGGTGERVRSNAGVGGGAR